MKTETILIKTGYWLGIGADALWTAILLSPFLFGLVTGKPDFNPDFETKQIMWIAATLMGAWTFLLCWGVQKPYERRFVILLTALVVFGLFLVAANGFFNGTTVLIWVLIKTVFLFSSMSLSYVLSGKSRF